MTILQAIQNECDNDFFVEKNYNVKNYKDACNYFYTRVIKPAIRDGGLSKSLDSRTSIYCEGLIKEFFSSEKNTLVYKIYVSSKASMEFHICISAIPNKNRNGWEIKVTHNSSNRNGSILISEDISRYVCESKLDELKNKLSEIEYEMKDITNYLSTKDSLTVTKETL